MLACSPSLRNNFWHKHSESKDLESDDKDTEPVQDDEPAETFVAENIVRAEEISDEKEDIEMQRLLRILLCFFLFWVIEIECIPRADGDEF